MVKYTFLLISSLCAFSSNCYAQTSYSNSLFGALYPLETSQAYVPPKELRWTVAASKMPYLPTGFQTNASLLAHFAGIQLEKQEWDPELKRTAILLHGCIYPSKSLILIPILRIEQMKIPENNLPASWQGKLQLRYQLNPNWRLTSQISFDPKQKEINQTAWCAGIQFHPNSIFEVEFNIRKNTLQDNFNTVILLKWMAHKKMNMCLGRTTKGELLWSTHCFFKKLSIASMLNVHPLLGTTFTIGIAGPLSFPARQ